MTLLIEIHLTFGSPSTTSVPSVLIGLDCCCHPLCIVSVRHTRTHTHKSSSCVCVCLTVACSICVPCRRSVFDVFNFLASKHRQPPEYRTQEEEEEEGQLRTARLVTANRRSLYVQTFSPVNVTCAIYRVAEK